MSVVVMCAFAPDAFSVSFVMTFAFFFFPSRLARFAAATRGESVCVAAGFSAAFSTGFFSSAKTGNVSTRMIANTRAMPSLRRL